MTEGDDLRPVVAYAIAYLATRQWNRLGLGAPTGETTDLDEDVALLESPAVELLAGVESLAAEAETRTRAEALLHAAGRDLRPLPDWTAPFAARFETVHRAVEDRLGAATIAFLVELGLWLPAGPDR